MYKVRLIAGVAAGRSREGARIEIELMWLQHNLYSVSPARERGLKSMHTSTFRGTWSRSREGAWIEIANLSIASKATSVAPVRERGLKLSASFVVFFSPASLPRGSVD